MLPLRYTRRWLLAGVFVLFAVFGAAIMPAFWSWPSLTAKMLLGFDKWLHVGTFLVLSVWFSGQYSRRWYWRIGVGLFTFGIIIELCQRMLTYRTGDLQDLAANVVGIALGLAIALAGIGGWSLRVEGWLMRRRQQA